jgi:uncharacterized protein YdaU (DUF1376 family)
MSLPYFPMFPTDFEAKTSHLTLAEDGAYNRLLRLMWMTPSCSLPDNDKWIMRRMRVDQATFDDVVLIVIDEFCTRENGRVSNAKLNRVFITSNDAHQKRVSAGSKGGKAKALNTNGSSPSKAQAKPKQPEPEPEPVRTDTKVSVSKPAKRKSQMPEDAVISDKMVEYATSPKRRHSVQEAEAQFDKFKNNALAKGLMFLNWDRAFLTWLDSSYFSPILSKGNNHGARTNNQIASQLATDAFVDENARAAEIALARIARRT